MIKENPNQIFFDDAVRLEPADCGCCCGCSARRCRVFQRSSVLGFRLLSRNPRGDLGPGERVFIHAGDNQVFELLTEPEMQPRSNFPVYPVGHVTGVPHLCFRVTDLPAW